MYKFNIIEEETAKTVNRTLDIQDNTKLQLLVKYVDGIQSSKEKQGKIFEMITMDNEEIDEIGTIFEIIASESEEEEMTEIKGKATYLIAILVASLKSAIVWKKIIKLINSRNVYKQHLDEFLSLECIHSRIMDAIDQYFKALVQIDEDFILDIEALPREFSHLQSIKLTEMIIILHHLLNHQDIGAIVSQKFLGEHNDLSPDFVKFLHASFRIIDM